MKKYDNYKDSGIEWIGEIPSGWSCTKLKFHTKKIIDGAHFTPTYIEKSNDSIPFLRVTDLHSKEILLDEVKYIPLSEHQELIKRCNPEMGDLLLSKNGTIGLMKIIDWDWEFSIFVSLCLLKFEKTLLNKFFYYFFESNIVDRQLFESSQKTSVSNLHLEKIKELRLTLPPISEQTAIANYLDQKTAQVDTLIAKKEQFISLLQEERTAVINQAVTKGLDPNSEMIFVDTEGLEEIPKHWKLMKFKWFAPILTCGVASTPEYVDESIGMPFLSAQNVKNNKMRLDKYRFITIDLHETLTKNRKPQNGDILVTRVGAGIGDACIVDCDFEFSVYVSLTHIRVDEKVVNNKFIMYFFSTDYCKYLNSQGTVTGGGVGNLNVNNVERYKVPIPPLNEQIKIVEFIENKTNEIDTIISKAQQEIELLKEYKIALISEVVTGKVDVRDIVLN